VRAGHGEAVEQRVQPDHQVGGCAQRASAGDAASGVAEDVDGEHSVVRAEYRGVGEPDGAGGAAAVQKEDRGGVNRAVGVDAGGAVRGGNVDLGGAGGPAGEECVVGGEEIVGHGEPPGETSR